jgi:hypothetical protein
VAETDPRDSELATDMERIRKLRNQGITAHHVITSFPWEQAAPLQRCDQPMWVFTGVSDTTRLQKGCLDKAKLGQHAKQLLGGTQGALWLPDGFLRL